MHSTSTQIEWEYFWRIQKMFGWRISAGASEKLPVREKPHAKTVAWSYDMEGHAKMWGERDCELANKKTEQLYNVSNPCLDDHHFKKKEELESVGELAKVCSQIALTCLYLARIGGPDTLSDHVGNMAPHCRSGLFQDSDFSGDLVHFATRMRTSYLENVELEPKLQKV